MSQKTIYIAGPMRGFKGFNFKAFDRSRDRWAAKGWRVISPADLDRQVGITEDYDPAKITPAFLRQCAYRDLVAIVKECDAISLPPDSHQYDSAGMEAEFAAAAWIGIDILVDDEWTNEERVGAE